MITESPFQCGHIPHSMLKRAKIVNWSKGSNIDSRFKNHARKQIVLFWHHFVGTIHLSAHKYLSGWFCSCRMFHPFNIFHYWWLFEVFLQSCFQSLSTIFYLFFLIFHFFQISFLLCSLTHLIHLLIFFLSSLWLFPSHCKVSLGTPLIRLLISSNFCSNY